MLPEIVSLSPLRSAALAWRSSRGAFLTVVCKATYTLAPATSPLADEQEYVNEDDNHWNDDPSRSLQAPSDLVPFKSRADVLVVGSAFVGDGTPRRALVARVVVGDIDKAVQVGGDRHWSQDGSLGDPAPFVKMPLRYERAGGGQGTSNPVGVRQDQVDALGKQHLPNLLPLGFVPTSRGQAIDPVGLGPIARSWPMRSARLGARASAWAAQPSFDDVLPEDLDATYFNVAPGDQQTDALRPNERLVLEHLHPNHVRLVTNLAGIEPRVFVEPRTGSPHELTVRADTLWIDTDRSLCTLCWRGQLPLESSSRGRIVVAAAMMGQRLTWSDVAPLAARRQPGSAGGPTSARRPQEITFVDEPVAAVDTTAPIRATPRGAPLPLRLPTRAVHRPPSSGDLPVPPRTPRQPSGEPPRRATSSRSTRPPPACRSGSIARRRGRCRRARPPPNRSR